MVAAGLPVPDVLVPADEVALGKPAPDGYLRAAELLGVAPDACLALEDAEPGVRSALDSGARVVVVGDLDTELHPRAAPVSPISAHCRSARRTRPSGE